MPIAPMQLGTVKLGSNAKRLRTIATLAIAIAWSRLLGAFRSI